MLTKKLQEAAGNASNPAYIEDVFSTYLYTGNGSTQTITNNIDLAGKGGLVWVKSRSEAYYNTLTDTVRGANQSLLSSETVANQNYSGSGSTNNFSSTGFSVGTSPVTNYANGTFASWTFLKQPKFFDVVTYTGTGAARTVAHSLGSVPGCIIVKGTTQANAGNWNVYHTSVGNGSRLLLNTTDATLSAATTWNNTSPTATQFTVGTSSQINASGETYVAYLFAHNAGGFGLTGTDNVISCGSYTGTGSNVEVNLGYEAQWVLIKKANGYAADWVLVDSMRGTPVGTAITAFLAPNLSNSENQSVNTYLIGSSATGFTVTGVQGRVNESGANYIYIAIRRGPMKVPTDGTKVFQPSTTTGANEILSTLEAGDLGIFKKATDASTYPNWLWGDRLRGFASSTSQLLSSNNTSAESTWSGSGDGVTAYYGNIGSSAGNGKIKGGGAGGADTPTLYSFRRAPSFFDEVCYTGNGAGTYNINHNLGVTPEMLIIKDRSVGDRWSVYFPAFDTFMTLNAINGKQNGSPLPSAVTSTTFNVGSTTGYASVAGRENTSGATYVSYLFATCAGVSKVGSYTGNGSSQTINCGFTGGARFVLIKRTDTTGDWYVWDTARGIVSGNDPHLSLNTTNAEVTSNDTIDTDSSGFIINQVSANNVNVSSATYIYLAIA